MPADRIGIAMARKYLFAKSYAERTTIHHAVQALANECPDVQRHFLQHVEDNSHLLSLMNVA